MYTSFNYTPFPKRHGHVPLTSIEKAKEKEGKKENSHAKNRVDPLFTCKESVYKREM
jgi:hypothetical protein